MRHNAGAINATRRCRTYCNKLKCFIQPTSLCRARLPIFMFVQQSQLQLVDHCISTYMMIRVDAAVARENVVMDGAKSNNR
eukprot:7384-Heterococcus_DN1.PRE.1